MTVLEIVSIVLNVLLAGGGLVAVVTLRAAKRKADAEAQGASLANDEKASQIMMEYIVEPLKKEINALRQDVRKLQRAVDKVSVCPHAADCPVRNELQDQKADCPEQ